MEKSIYEFEVWKAFSYIWTENGIDDGEKLHADKLRGKYPSWSCVDKILFRDVCPSFAVESSMFYAAIFPPLLLVFGVSPFPDWSYDDDYLEERIQAWRAKPYWRHFINPLRVLGYPVALLLVLSLRRKLKRLYHGAA